MSAPAVPESVPPSPKAAVIVANALRRRVVLGEVPVGGSLPAEDVLCEEMGVSRPTLRAALRILESEDLITVRRGSRGGASVHAPTPEALAARAGVYLHYNDITLDELYRAQAVIEPAAVRALALRADPDDVATLQRSAGIQAGDVGRVESSLSALGFHRALMDLAGDRMLSVFAAMIHGSLEAYVEARTVRPPTPLRVGAARQRQHRRLIELIAAGDAEEAAAHWARHLESTRVARLREHGAEATFRL